MSERVGDASGRLTPENQPAIFLAARGLPFRRALIGNGFFSMDEPERYRAIYENLTWNGDHYLLLADYASYIACQERVSALYQDQDEWARRAILNVAHMGKFSSDRTIKEYADNVWGVKGVKR